MPRISTSTLRRKATRGEKIVMVTCYDATFAQLVERAGADAILIGDSLGMVIQGHQTTVPVTVDEIIYHCRAVARGCEKPHLVGDLPFGSYQQGPDQAMRTATRLLKEGGVQAVKLEGGERTVQSVHHLTQAGIPVMGHLGLTPQSVHQFGGWRLQGKTKSAADQLVADAQALQDAGAYAIVLEGIPAAVAERITAQVKIPTIGIGAGPHCGGQVLVLYDLLGLDDRFNPKFLKKYDDLSTRVTDAISAYAEEVRTAAFPTDEHSR